MREALSLVEREYVRPLSREALVSLSRERKLEALDPYSEYLRPATLAQFDRDLKGVFGGVGIRLDETQTNIGFRVRGPMFGSPALAAGVRAGDVVLTVDSRPTRAWTIDQMLAAMTGMPGSSVAIEVQSERGEDIRRLAIRRAIISVPTVRGLRLDANGKWQYLLGPGGVAYVRITAFAETTVADFDRALDAIAEKDAAGLVIDLRANVGGLASAATQIADRLIDVGRLVKYRERHGEEVTEATPGMRVAVPIAVLVDGGTASSGELFAAALQDHRRATIVGARTFGKGMVQKVFRLQHGGAAKLTIADYVRPSGAPIERHAPGGDAERGGVWPDPGMAVSASDVQWAKWREELSEHDALAILALEKPVASPLIDDPVLRLALAELERQRPDHVRISR